MKQEEGEKKVNHEQNSHYAQVEGARSTSRAALMEVTRRTPRCRFLAQCGWGEKKQERKKKARPISPPHHQHHAGLVGCTGRAQCTPWGLEGWREENVSGFTQRTRYTLSRNEGGRTPEIWRGGGESIK